VVAAAIFGVYSLATRSARVPFQHFTITRITDSGKASLAAISPDGKYVVHVADNNGTQELWLRHIPTSSNTQIAAGLVGQYNGVGFTPDGNYIYFARYESRRQGVGMLYRVPVLGGTPKLVFTDIDSGFAFSPDGKLVAFDRQVPQEQKSSLVIVDAETGSNENVLYIQYGGGVGSTPAWSPDGKTIVMSSFVPDRRPLSIVHSIDVATKKETEIARMDFANAFAWMPDQRGLMTTLRAESTGFQRQIAYLTYPAGKLQPITSDVNSYSNDSVSLTADGKGLLSVIRDASSHVDLLDYGNLSASPALLTTAKDIGKAVSFLSKDKLLIVPPGSKNSSVKTINLDGSGEETLFSDVDRNSQGTVCGDQKHAVYFLPERSKHIFRMDIDGSDRKEITSGDSSDVLPICSPDGKWFMYLSIRKKDSAIWRANIDGNNPVKLRDGLGEPHAISPDGKWIAVSTGEGATPEAFHYGLYVLPSSGGKAIAQFSPNMQYVSQIQFSPDGKALILAINNGPGNLFIQPMSGGPMKQLTNFKSLQINSFSISPDGKHVAVNRGIVSSDAVLLTDTSH
jgi:eukaryotic-like serine/threonine-protein kinase